jgi:CMP-N-acetylneuraminic acid synthetase
VIYPASPLLCAKDLDRGLALLSTKDNYVMSVGPDGEDAGCFYWGWIGAFRQRRPLGNKKTQKVILPAERVCDINTLEDLGRAEIMFNTLLGAP